MPELPEVETIRRGLAPLIEGAHIDKVTLNRPDLRFPFPKHFAERLTGSTIVATGRRAKYLLFSLSSGETWLSHLGMTGSYRFADQPLAEPTRLNPASPDRVHDHVILDLAVPDGPRRRLIYTDARRFGFMDLFRDPQDCRFLKDLGPEPTGNAFSAQGLAARWSGKRAPVKTALLDQSHVAGLGNIYVCEALHRAGIHPQCPVGSLVAAKGAPRPELDALVAAIRDVLAEAIEAGGSTLRDYRNAGGGEGYFQHSFAVYGRAGEPCLTPGCAGSCHAHRPVRPVELFLSAMPELRTPEIQLTFERLATITPRLGGRGAAAFISIRHTGSSARLGARGHAATKVTRTFMANTPSAKKATRKIARQTAVNKSRRSRMRGFIRRVEEAIASGDKTAASEALKAAQPEIQRAAGKGIVHRNTADRKVSRLAGRIKALA